MAFESINTTLTYAILIAIMVAGIAKGAVNSWRDRSDYIILVVATTITVVGLCFLWGRNRASNQIYYAIHSEDVVSARVADLSNGTQYMCMAAHRNDLLRLVANEFETATPITLNHRHIVPDYIITLTMRNGTNYPLRIAASSRVEDHHGNAEPMGIVSLLTESGSGYIEYASPSLYKSVVNYVEYALQSCPSVDP